MFSGLRGLSFYLVLCISTSEQVLCMPFARSKQVLPSFSITNRKDKKKTQKLASLLSDEKFCFFFLCVRARNVNVKKFQHKGVK